MNLLRISFAYLRARPLDTALNLLLLALGIGTITLVLLATPQLEERMGRDARGIDLVAGAKGSPMQLILAAHLPPRRADRKHSARRRAGSSRSIAW